ncbi:hypothetical protein [Corynebacterium sp. UBA2622]|uniref:hypothetical protein n=1 Tax=Corynebacterium sp. UBA2622 TaxID=1946393 RepID=UPI0025C5D1B9|nr:hypothetical protein [Corynebacterium sp. UBA2622]
MRPRTAVAPVAVAGAVLAGTLPGCASRGDTAGLNGPTWQIVGIYTDPDNTADLPADAAGRATLAFGGTSMHGQTGCAPLQAKVSSQGDSLRLDDVRIDNPGDCKGGARHVHDQLAGLFTSGAEFDVRHFGDAEAVLTRRGGEVNAPAIRVMKP